MFYFSSYLDLDMSGIYTMFKKRYVEHFAITSSTNFEKAFTVGKSAMNYV